MTGALDVERWKNQKHGRNLPQDARLSLEMPALTIAIAHRSVQPRP
ncbi:hypothetical protein ACVBEF_13865 [Glaciimonas sp. GG7]